MSAVSFDRSKLPSWFHEEAYAATKDFTEQDWARAILVRHNAWIYSNKPVYPVKKLPRPQYTNIDELLLSVNGLAERFESNLKVTSASNDLSDVCQAQYKRLTQKLSIVSVLWDYVIAVRNLLSAEASCKRKLEHFRNDVQVINANLAAVFQEWKESSNESNRAMCRFFEVYTEATQQNWGLLEVSQTLLSGQELHDQDSDEKVSLKVLSGCPEIVKSWIKSEMARVLQANTDSSLQALEPEKLFRPLLLTIISEIGLELWRANYSLQYFTDICGKPSHVALERQEPDKEITISYYKEDGVHPAIFVESFCSALPIINTLSFGDLMWERGSELFSSGSFAQCWRLLESVEPAAYTNCKFTGPEVSNYAPLITDLLNKKTENAKEFETAVVLHGRKAACTVDLSASDTELYNGFKSWLKEQRSQPEAIKPKSRTMSRWSEYQLLPVIDLMLWQSIGPSFQPTREEMADILYMDTVRLRDTVEPLAKDLLASCDWLLVLARTKPVNSASKS